MPYPAYSVILVGILVVAGFLPQEVRAQGAEPVGENDWMSHHHPCADSLGSENTEERVGARASEPGSGTVLLAGEDCDPDEALLFQRIPPQERTRESRHTAFSLSQNHGKSLQSVLRSRATHGGWDHRLEIRGDTLTRVQFGWRGGGWRLVVGDLVGDLTGGNAGTRAGGDMFLRPRQLPHRTLPRGWRPARGTPDAPQPFAPTRPQGLAAGVSQPGWNAYALRTWNPVESGTEPPWHAAWDLRHHAAGVAITTPWTLALHASETRVTRAGGDSLAENLLAASLTAPGRSLDVIIARGESDRMSRAGWMLGADIEHKFSRDAPLVPGATIDLTLRQRDADWNSAWDPAVSGHVAALAALADDSMDSTDRDWGAGEVRMTSRLPFHQVHPGKRSREQGFLRGELWRAWNPAAATDRQGARGTFGWRTRNASLLPEARFEMTATSRTSRAGSGSVSLYRYAEAETRLESFPRWRASAWRAWNREGPLRTGLFLGAEPVWKTTHGSVTLSPGLRLEVKETKDGEDDWGGMALLGLSWRPGSGWHLDVSSSIPCWPPGSAADRGAARWRVTVTGR